jgi:hypothetical protein
MQPRIRCSLYPRIALPMLLLMGSATAQQAPLPAQAQGKNDSAKQVVYRDTKYGFSFVLPRSWKGYKVLWETWEGTFFDSSRTMQGPMIIFRNSRWRTDKPTEDIPVMIYTITQWDASPIVSSAPVGPGELGRNRKYVFALPARWAYDGLDGWEEAFAITGHHPLHAFPPGKK